jgi:hypothetical protein
MKAMLAVSERRDRHDRAAGNGEALRDADHGTPLSMPPWARWTLASVLAIALAGALYLIAVRGEALLVDLAKLGRVFCF